MDTGHPDQLCIPNHASQPQAQLHLTRKQACGWQAAGVDKVGEIRYNRVGDDYGEPNETNQRGAGAMD